ncbi:MAG: Ig-like domain-containing protein, partial [Lachnospiraceae bacterium]|nr:Ig-like domain-containing protein [Lachnospiraceae bacterium]
NKKIVSVNKKGELRARKVGKTTITVKSGKKKKKITCIVTE